MSIETAGPPIARYRFNADVLDVVEHFEVVGGRKSDEGTEILKRSIGWFMHLSTCASIYLGAEKPSIAKGDKITIIIEKQP